MKRYRVYGWEWDRFVLYWYHLGAEHLSLGITIWWRGPNIEIHLPGGFLRVGVPSEWREHRWTAKQLRNFRPVDRA